MVRITLIDGNIKEMAKEKMLALSHKDFAMEMDYKAVVNVEFFKQEGSEGGLSK